MIKIKKFTAKDSDDKKSNLSKPMVTKKKSPNKKQKPSNRKLDGEKFLDKADVPIKNPKTPFKKKVDAEKFLSNELGKVKKFSESVITEKATLIISKKVEVPEKDITECIEMIEKWFESNPTKDVCNPSMFGHHIWPVNRKSISKDVRECAKNAGPYKKV